MDENSTSAVTAIQGLRPSKQLLLGHSSVITTEAYLRRLDMTRIYADAYERAGRDAGLIDAAAQREADEEFADEGPDGWDNDGGSTDAG